MPPPKRSSGSQSKRRLVATGRYLWQLPSNVWQYSPAWQKCQMREFVAWHSHVLTVTSPSPQWANRLNLTAANASCAKRLQNIKARAISRVFTSTPQCFPARMRFHGMKETTQRRGAMPVLAWGRLRRSRANLADWRPHWASRARCQKGSNAPARSGFDASHEAGQEPALLERDGFGSNHHRALDIG
jgi:hypothetical protein